MMSRNCKRRLNLIFKTIFSIILIAVSSASSALAAGIDDFEVALKAKDYAKAKDIYYALLEEGIFNYSTWDSIGDVYKECGLYEGAAICYMSSFNLAIKGRKDVDHIHTKLNQAINSLQKDYPGYIFSICPLEINNTREMLDSFYYDGTVSRLKTFEENNMVLIPGISIVPLDDYKIDDIPVLSMDRDLAKLLTPHKTLKLDKTAEDDTPIPSPDDFIQVEVQPQCDLNELTSNIIYPEVARKANIEGKIIVRLWIDKTGKPRSAEVIKSTSILFVEAALTAIMETEYLPAHADGEPVGCWLTIPIKFSLTN